MISENNPSFAATRNACKLCTPLGACLAFRGVEAMVPLLHGSQGCSTYIRRYMISHFKEPIDIASTNFSEATAIFGGGQNFRWALENVIRAYSPQAVGIATTCLSETIGDDVPGFLRNFRETHADQSLPEIVCVSTASYRGTHADGFQAALKAIVETVAQGVAQGKTPGRHVNLLPGMVSPADLRYLKEIALDFGVDMVLLSDYSDTLDGPAWQECSAIPPGGTTLADIRRMGSAQASVEFGMTTRDGQTAGAALSLLHGVACHRMPVPFGVRHTDKLFETFAELSGRPMPEKHRLERGRLIDSYVDAHKHVFGKRAVVYGEEDFVIGLASLLTEVGIEAVLCASGGASGKFREHLCAAVPGLGSETVVVESYDFADMDRLAADLMPDLIVGNSKGYALARRLEIPLVRAGFPIHDRIGGARLLHIGYRGAQQLFDRIANALTEQKQSASDIGYSYM